MQFELENVWICERGRVGQRGGGREREKDSERGREKASLFGARRRPIACLLSFSAD